MRITKCKEITIRFNSPSHQVLRTSFRHGPSTVQSLLVQCDEKHLEIQYLDKDQEVVKSTTYNFAHVLEYECDDIIREPRP